MHNGRSLRLINKGFYCCAGLCFLVYAQSTCQGSWWVLSSALCFVKLCPKKSTFPFITPTEQMVCVLFSKESLKDLCAITGVENYWRHSIKKKKKVTAKPQMNAWITTLFCILVHTCCCREILYFLFLGSGQIQATLREAYPPASVHYSYTDKTQLQYLHHKYDSH